MKINGIMAARYERVEKMTKEPMKALNAVEEPIYMQPNIVENTAQATVELKGILNLDETTLSVVEKGTAWSRAKVHRVRPQVI